MSREDYSLINFEVRRSLAWSEMTVNNIRAGVQEALSALSSISPVDLGDQDALGVEHVESLAKAHNALYNLDRLIPRVETWVVGYWWGMMRDDPEDRAWTSWSAHRTEDEARKYLPLWIAQEEGGGRNASDWQVRFTACDIDKFVPDGTDPAIVMEGVFRR